MTGKEDDRVLDFKAVKRAAELEKLSTFDTLDLTDDELDRFIRERIVDFLVEELIPVVNEQGRRLLELEELLQSIEKELRETNKNKKGRSL